MKIDKQYIAGKALIFNTKGEVLLLQQSSEAEVDGANDYHLPGGIVDFGEQVEDALIREIREEIGVESTVTELIDVKHWVSNIRGETIQIFGVFYVAEVDSDEFVFEEAEVQNYAWINKDNVDEYNILEPSLSIVRTKLKA